MPTPRVIAKGAQYRVLEDTDGWVHKELLTLDESRQTIASWYPEGNVPAQELEVDYPQLALDSCKRIQPLLRDYPPLRQALGEPTIYSKGGYRQRKVQPITNSLLHGQPQDKRALVDCYVDLTLDLWQYGIADTAFKCLVDYGMTLAGRMILLDLGEITNKRSHIIRDISTKGWLRTQAYRCLPGDIQSYYRAQLEQRLTLDALHSQWKVALEPEVR